MHGRGDKLMIASERFNYILTSLQQRGVIDIKSVAAELGISEATVRRDFEKLEAEGKLTRVLGGAKQKDGFTGEAELTMRQRMIKKVNLPEKDSLAEYSSSLVEDGECIFIDAGTTFMPLFGRLVNRPIRIVTYSTLPFPMIRSAAAEIIFIGGSYSPFYNAVTGALSQELLSRFTFNRAFIGCSGLSADFRTAYTTEIECLTMKNIAMRNSEKKYLVLDVSKVGVTSFYKFSPTDAFDNVICNRFDADDLPQNFILV